MNSNDATNFDDRPLNELTAAAQNAQNALGLKHTPVVVRSEATAFAIAGQTSMGRTSFRMNNPGWPWAAHA